MSQVNKAHYNFDRYGHVGRFASYHYQIRDVLALSPQSVLEIGVGDKVFGNYLTSQTSIAYTSLDTAPDLAPDVVGDATMLPFPDKSFDTVVAFQVLEHLPYDRSLRALSEMARVAKKAIVLSVPHFGPELRFFLKIPFVPALRLALKVPYPTEHQFNGEHYWELGKRGYPVSRLRRDLARLGTITRDYIPFEYQYHHFFTVVRADMV